MRIVITPSAFDDLAATAGYVSQDNPAAAGRLVDRVFEVIDLLAEGGLDGPLTTLRSGVEVRSWPVPPLRIFYRREADEPRDLWSICNSARLPPRNLRRVASPHALTR